MFEINSDNPLDKTILIIEDSFSIAPTTVASKSVPHNLPFTPLVYGNWSTDPSFSISYEYGSGPLRSNPSPSFFTLAPTNEANATEVTIGAFSWASSTTTIYFRVYGLEPTTSSALVPHTNTGVDSFMINSDQEQVQLIKADYFDFPTRSFGDPLYTQVLFDHNLGYRPQVMLWIERSGTIIQKVNSSPDTGSVDIIVTTSQAILSIAEPAVAGRLHYRIYSNE